ncbi:MAG TPA: lysylphosphatidylglycerol synthase domain-containing protein [Thermodesulfobacteriota bacterium]|nr:lysylphosphatidylglycerol synthase domain-containing protein [Thermodesulfobacteriota bacterium]
MRKFHTGSIVVGAVLLAYLILKIGPGELWQELRAFGWGLVPFILLEGVVGLFYTLGWARCLSPAHRDLPFAHLWAVNLAGNSISYFTPTATLGGEVVKGALLSLDRRGAEAAAGVMIAKLSYALAQLMGVVIGSLCVVWKIQLPLSATLAMGAASALLGGGMVAFLLIQRAGKLGSLVRWAVDHGIGGEALKKAARRITEVDESLKLFYRERPRDLPISMLWHGVGMIFGVVKTWYFVSVVAGGGLFGGAGVFFLSSWFDLVTFMVPLGIGVQEGSRVLAFRVMGFSLAAGLGYGVALRLEQIFWASFGLFLYARILGGKTALRLFRAGAAPESEKFLEK